VVVAMYLREAAVLEVRAELLKEGVDGDHGFGGDERTISWWRVVH